MYFELHYSYYCRLTSFLIVENFLKILTVCIGHQSVNTSLRFGPFAHSHTICYLWKYYLLNCSPFVARVSILGWVRSFRTFTPYVPLRNTFCSIDPLGRRSVNSFCTFTPFLAIGNCFCQVAPFVA